MRCERCGRDFQSGLANCPHCGADAHYGGNTTFYAKAASQKLTIADLFNGVFAKHPKGTGARMFMSGTALSTPSPDRMLSEWTKPWLFLRVLGIGLIYGILVYILASRGWLAGIYSVLSFGALIIPLGVLIFFWEINIPRDIPLYTVLLIFFIGGVISLLLPEIFGHKSITDETAYLAGFTEEPAKLIATVIFICLLKPKYIFGGLLIGAAVGTGFSVMESVSYNLGYITNYGYDAFGVSMQSLIARNIDSIGTHIIWAAMEGGALCAAKGLGKLEPKNFIDVKFLPYFAASVALHFIHNADFGIATIPIFGDVKYVLIIAAGFFAIFTLIKQALNQVMQVVDGAVPMAVPTPEAGSPVLTMLGGPLQGSEFPLSGVITVGRDASCNVVLPPNTAGVSRRHCSVENRPDGLYVMDLGSTSGTFLQSGQRLPVNQWVRVSEPFYLGSRDVMLNVKQPVAAGAYAYQPQPGPSAGGYAAAAVTMLSGPLKGSQFPLSGVVTVGRDPSCNVVLPANTAGVSRRHCSIDCRPDGVYVMDLGSTSGTFLQSGQRLPVNQWVKVTEPFCLGSKDIVLYVQQ